VRERDQGKSKRETNSKQLGTTSFDLGVGILGETAMVVDLEKGKGSTAQAWASIWRKRRRAERGREKGECVCVGHLPE
jgi:hypothetical protein